MQLNDQIKRLISIVGPTAVGKTRKAIELAELIGTEIISADARQFYREMTIGTAKPSKNELSQIKHHFVDTHSVHEFYSAGAFERDALAKLEELFVQHDAVVSVGGSGLYLKALWQGLDDIPKAQEGIREKLNEELKNTGLESLLAELATHDPIYYAQVDRKNHQRVIRALEVIRSTGEPFSSFRQNSPKGPREFSNVKIGLEMDRDQLFKRIDTRMDEMIASGLFEEAESLYPLREMNALQTVGYKEIFGYMDGAYNKDEAVRLLRRNSRRYAKRQMTWFKADLEIKWFDAQTSVEDILARIKD